MKVGDRVRVTSIPPVLPDDPELRTKHLFELCVGRVFPIAVLQGELLELEVGEVMGEPAYMHSIWIEPQFVRLVRRAAE
jgi:hypothetical protein